MTSPSDFQSSRAVTSDNQIQQDIGRNQGQAIGQMYGGQAIDADLVISAEQVTIQYGQEKNPSQPLLNLELEIPPLLPYLPNRGVQEFELCQAIQKIHYRKLRRPLICVVHGDEYQSHDTFFQRLKEVCLPCFLGLDLSQTTIKKYHLRGWRPARSRNVQTVPDRLSKCLADVVENYGQATIDKVNQTMGSHPGPVLVEMHLLTEDWLRLGDEVLPKILEFWRNWPELAANQSVVVCLFVKYQLPPVSNIGCLQILRPVTMIRRWLRNYRYKQLNNQISRQIELLDSASFELSDRQYLQSCEVVLPRLTNIEQSHVEEWVRCKETQAFAGSVGIGQLVNAVRNIAEQCETMAMDHVALRLTKLLEETVVSQRKVR